MSRNARARLTALVGGLLLLGAAASPALAADKTVKLQAVQTTRSIRGRTITFWVFDDLDTTGILARRIPGPQIDCSPSQGLVVELTNNLPLNVAGDPSAGPFVSLILPGQALPTVWVPGASSALAQAVVRTTDGRIRSLLPETAPGATRIYKFPNLGPGTFLYQSGTHMALQRQMGLYGALTKPYRNISGAPTGDGQAYPGGAGSYRFGTSTTIVYSEIDPGLHDAVANGTYGTSAFPSTIDYLPRFFLINGELNNTLEADGKPAAVKVVDATNNPNDDPVLIRLLNAGLTDKVPTLLGGHFRVIAEDGRTANVKEQYSVILTPGKTKDLLLDVQANGKYPLFDRRLYRTGGSTTAGGGNGGLIAYIEFDM